MHVISSLGCRKGPIVARQALNDPLLQFDNLDLIDPPYSGRSPITKPLPPNTFTTRADYATEPGYDARTYRLDSEVRFAIGFLGGFGLEAGYGYLSDNHFVQKMDDFSDPLKVERTSYGPNVALLMDDGVSLLRLGYRYRESSDGILHEPELVARTNVLGDDTVLEIGYNHSTSSLKIPMSQHPAKEPIDDLITMDRIQLAVEQGFLPGWKIRWELAVQLENGFLHSPYRLVTLWPDFSPDKQPGSPPTQTEAENHPDTRMRWGTRFRVLRWFPSLSSIIEMGIEHGSGTWRVEHSAATLGYMLRIADPMTLSIVGGVYHQTRADFYRDVYLDGPVDSHWTAERNLSSFLATWAQVKLQWMFFNNRGRWLGFLKQFAIRLHTRFVTVDYDWPDAGLNRGYTIINGPADGEKRKLDAGMIFFNCLEFEGGF